MEAESLQPIANMYFDARAVDEDEDIDENYSDYSDDSADDRGDNCTDGYSDCDQGKPCSSTIQLQDITDCRNNCFELALSKLDLDHPGVVLCKEYWSSAELAFNILQSEWNLPQVEVLPSVINPKGINRERAEDLYKEIREFCRPGTEDLVAPEVNN
ncbi:hypothetical protein P5673_027725 [Acropora cervicornis]|uniref:Uncharacterized protein n=1 Tax=Acropora cervicornis TaxID=6130 RepID=A0AAD9PY74_ACRCE|nr:hypothetical protein P5673_027725 [Acropora cervicornis]